MSASILPRLSPSHIRDVLLLTLGAGLYTLAAPPYEWSATAWLALTPFYYVLSDKTPKSAFWVGAVFGLLFSAGLAYWVYFSLVTFFPVSSVLAAAGTLLVYLIFVSPYTGLVAMGSCLLIRQGARLRWLGIPALWVSGELARALFSGFAWELLGYTQYRQLPLIQIVDITGVYGLSFILALSGYVGAECTRSLLIPHFSFPIPHSSFRRLPWRALGTLTIGVGLVLLYGTVRLDQYAVPVNHSDTEHVGHVVRVAVVQGDGTDERRWQPAHYASTLLRYAKATRQGVHRAQPDLQPDLQTDL